MPFVKKAPLPGLSNEVDWQTLVARLQTGTPEERWSASRALAGEKRALPALAAALAEARDAPLREIIFTSLVQQNSIVAFDVILVHLRSDDAELRSLALDALQLMPAQASARLADLFKDGDSDIRVLACELARQLPQRDAALLLAGLLETEQEINVCAAAIEMLAEIGGPPELPSLAACAGRFPAEFFLNFSVNNASERIRARALS